MLERMPDAVKLLDIFIVAEQFRFAGKPVILIPHHPSLRIPQLAFSDTKTYHRSDGLRGVLFGTIFQVSHPNWTQNLSGHI
jgi:hypothetical protein